jgi:hypothetical protein
MKQYAPYDNSRLDNIPFMEYILFMEWIIEFDEDFSIWFESLEEDLRDEIKAVLKVLAEFGPALRRPELATSTVRNFRK